MGGRVQDESRILVWCRSVLVPLHLAKTDLCVPAVALQARLGRWVLPYSTVWFVAAWEVSGSARSEERDDVLGCMQGWWQCLLWGTSPSLCKVSC